MIAPYLVAGLLFTQTPPATAPPDADTPPTLTEVERLRLDNHALKLRVVQLEQQVQAAALTEERATLDAALKAAYPGWRMDWQAGRLVRVEDAPEDASKEP